MERVSELVLVGESVNSVSRTGPAGGCRLPPTPAAARQSMPALHGSLFTAQTRPLIVCNTPPPCPHPVPPRSGLSRVSGPGERETTRLAAGRRRSGRLRERNRHCWTTDTVAREGSGVMSEHRVPTDSGNLIVAELRLFWNCRRSWVSTVDYRSQLDRPPGRLVYVSVSAGPPVVRLDNGTRD